MIKHLLILTACCLSFISMASPSLAFVVSDTTKCQCYCGGVDKGVVNGTGACVSTCGLASTISCPNIGTSSEAGSAGMPAKTPTLSVPIPDLKFTDVINLSCSGSLENKNLICRIPWIAEYIQGIFKYSLAIAGILATVVMMYGGLRWLASAGNAQAIGDAKAWIAGAITGLIILFTSYIILFTVNPDLVSMKAISISTISKDEIEYGQGCGDSCGTCSVPETGNCSIAFLRANGGDCFGSDINKMAAICNRESRGNASISGKADACKYTVGGVTQTSSFSFGLFQINALNNAGDAPICKNSFSGKVSKQSCLERTTNSKGASYCKYFSCQPSAGAQQCINYLSNPANNIKAACALYKKAGLRPWGTVTTKVCDFK